MPSLVINHKCSQILMLEKIILFLNSIKYYKINSKNFYVHVTDIAFYVF